MLDASMWLPTGKEIWDALEAKLSVSNATIELFVMEQFHIYKMVHGRSVVE